jgi:hypothetical protein
MYLAVSSPHSILVIVVKHISAASKKKKSGTPLRRPAFLSCLVIAFISLQIALPVTYHLRHQGN